MTYPRYVYKDIPLTEEEARRKHLDAIDSARENLASLRQALEEAQADYYAALEKPLPTTRRVQVTLLPGDAGYDEAPASFDPINYQGDAAWMNTRTILTP